MKTSAIRWIRAVARQPLRPITIAVAGPLSLGLAYAVAVFLSLREKYLWSQLWVAFGIGVVLGLTVFAPIATALAFRARLADWLGRYGFHVQWYVSMSMAISLGYVAASVHQKAVDDITVVAMLVVFACALAKTALGIAFRDGGEPPESRTVGGPRPPSAPVLRPPGGRPPVLSEAARLKQDALG